MNFDIEGGGYHPMGDLIFPHVENGKNGPNPSNINESFSGGVIFDIWDRWGIGGHEF